jgi:hypothetical protein
MSTNGYDSQAAERGTALYFFYYVSAFTQARHVFYFVPPAADHPERPPFTTIEQEALSYQSIIPTFRIPRWNPYFFFSARKMGEWKEIETT